MRLKQYISCPWDAHRNHSAIRDYIFTRFLTLLLNLVLLIPSHIIITCSILQKLVLFTVMNNRRCFTIMPFICGETEKCCSACEAANHTFHQVSYIITQSNFFDVLVQHIYIIKCGVLQELVLFIVMNYYIIMFYNVLCAICGIYWCSALR